MGKLKCNRLLHAADGATIDIGGVAGRDEIVNSLAGNLRVDMKRGRKLAKGDCKADAVGALRKTAFTVCAVREHFTKNQFTSTIHRNNTSFPCHCSTEGRRKQHTESR